MYHYTESGLRNVWLENGFEEVETDYGTAVLINNVEGLHDAIARSLITQPYLSGREFRFLRVHLDLTQKQVGGMMGLQAQTVALWEKRGRVPKYADLVLRCYYSNVPVADVLKQLEEASGERYEPCFHHRRKNWEFGAEC